MPSIDIGVSTQKPVKMKVDQVTYKLEGSDGKIILKGSDGSSSEIDVAETLGMLSGLNILTT